MMDKTFFYQNVDCSICGKNKKIKIRKSDRKIISKNFYYFGKIDVNSWKKSKYVYDILFDKNNKMSFDKDGRIKMNKIKNILYDKNAKPHYVYYYECEKCHKG